jgi:hypothetical protein
MLQELCAPIRRVELAKPASFDLMDGDVEAPT